MTETTDSDQTAASSAEEKRPVPPAIEEPLESAELDEHRQWFYADSDREEHGPVSFGELVGLIRRGQLAGEDLVWNPSLTKWRKISQVDELVLALPGTILRGRFQDDLYLGPIDRIRNWSPSIGTIRLTGRLFGLLGLCVFAVSIITLPWQTSWFTGALLMFLIFVVCEATAKPAELLEEFLLISGDDPSDRPPPSAEEDSD